jgi:hypothetical protein
MGDEALLHEPQCQSGSGPPRTADAREARTGRDERRDDPPTLRSWPPPPRKWAAASFAFLNDRLATAVDEGRWDDVEGLELQLFALLDDDRFARRDALLASGDRWWRKAGDLPRARVRYRDALKCDSISDRAKVRLRAIAHEIARRRIQPYRPAD